MSIISRARRMATGFRANIFDPVLIVAQIMAMQCCFYLSTGAWLLIADFIGGVPISLDQMLDYHEFEGSYDGWLVMGAVVLNSFTCALALLWIVRKAKQVTICFHWGALNGCLDFTVTVFLLHLLICLCYGGLPRSWAWWLTHLVSLAIAAILGEYMCMKSELAAIPLTGKS